MEGLVQLTEKYIELTGNFVATEEVPCGSKITKEIYLYIAYTMGEAENLNAIVFQIEWSTDWGTTWFIDSTFHEDSDAITAGAVTADKKEFVYGSDSPPGTYDYIVAPFKVKGNMVRVSFREVNLKGGAITNYGYFIAYLGFNQ